VTVAAFVLLLGAALALPRAFAPTASGPLIGAWLWTSVLALRAVIGIIAVATVLLIVPTTPPFATLTQWCWHAVLPWSAAHLRLDGHMVGDLASMLPAIAISLSGVSAVWALLRAARAVRRLLGRALGRGPMDTVIVGGPQVLIAAAGLRRPRVVVSAGALTAMDDEELGAGVEHERGHIARQHRWLLLFAELCRALSFFLPGGQHAQNQLVFQLERDADDYALARRHGRLALASAICKAALSAPSRPTFQSLGGSSMLATRLALLAGEPSRPSRSRWMVAGSGVLASMLTAAMLSALPAMAALAGGSSPANSLVHCPT